MEASQETIIEPIEHEPAVYLSINNIYKGDCLNIMPNITPKTVKLVIVDLPYGQTDCAWDVKIDLKKMWKQLKRITLDSGQFVFFTTTKFGNDLILTKPGESGAIKRDLKGLAPPNLPPNPFFLETTL